MKGNGYKMGQNLGTPRGKGYRMGQNMTTSAPGTPAKRDMAAVEQRKAKMKQKMEGVKAKVQAAKDRIGAIKAGKPGGMGKPRPGTATAPIKGAGRGRPMVGSKGNMK